MEYAAADASLAIMARALGHTGRRVACSAERSRWYRNLWDAGDPASFRPRTSDGTWLAPVRPRRRRARQFHEGGAYQYQWLAPQDPAGLVTLMGGRAATEKRLDDFFAYDKLLADPAGTARTDWIEATYAYYSKPTYNPNNEPDLLAPYVYAWVQQPAKIATVVRAAFTLFTNGPDGMTGNDDLGTMSAWYVFSSWGLYPTMSGANYFVVSSPQFERVDIDVASPTSARTGQGGRLTITAPGVSDDRRYVQTLTVDGRKTTRELGRLGRAAATVAPWLTPSARRRAAGGPRPPTSRPRRVQAGRDPRLSLSMTARRDPVVVPTGAARGALRRSMSSARPPRACPSPSHVTTPQGWSASLGSGHEGSTVLRSDGVPAQRLAPGDAHAAAGLGAGTPRADRHRVGARASSHVVTNRHRPAPGGAALRPGRRWLRRGPFRGVCRVAPLSCRAEHVCRFEWPGRRSTNLPKVLARGSSRGYK